jgi:hypothetical protein
MPGQGTWCERKKKSERKNPEGNPDRNVFPDEREEERERESERERNASHLSDPFLWLVRLSDKL